jgi:hypothetical protein
MAGEGAQKAQKSDQLTHSSQVLWLTRWEKALRNPTIVKKVVLFETVFCAFLTILD